MKYAHYFFCISFFSYISISGMDGSQQAPTPSLNLHPLARTLSCELKNEELAKDAGMIKAVVKAAGKAPSPRSLKACSGSPRIEGRQRASSLSKDTTEYLAITADASK